MGLQHRRRQRLKPALKGHGGVGNSVVPPLNLSFFLPSNCLFSQGFASSAVAVEQPGDRRSGLTPSPPRPGPAGSAGPAPLASASGTLQSPLAPLGTEEPHETQDCLSRTAHFPPFCRSKRRSRGQTRTQRIRSGGSAWGRRIRSSLSWREEQPSWQGSNFRRCSPRPAGSAPGGRHKPLSASPRRTVAAAAPGAGAGRLRQASVSPAAGGGQAPSRLPPGSVLLLSPPGEDYSARRSLRAAHTPRLSPLSLPPASREPDPARPRERGCAAGQGRQGRGAAAAGGGHARGRRRGGAGRPRPRPVRGNGSSQPRCPVPSAPVAAAHEVKMVIRVFVASSSGSVAIKKRQQDVVRFLEANRIEFEEVDITMSEEKRQWMYKNIPEDRQPAQGNPLPPQIFSDDRYCGDYDGFFESKESNTVFSFLGLKPTLASKESEP
ncbi:SH3 domain-binding glutamic acid-rich-like protein 2 [Agelaius tricolor]|uniref:SH3 domain-binding glutamic acid-rich-like protein 2 n=1 Tax=Agelaius tricolor TaxID=9191 RepID=UPI0039F25714